MARYGVEERLVWLNGETVPVRDARINVLAPTSQFGLNVFEGIPCFWSDERQELYAFRLEDHYQRLIRSAHLLQIECPYSPEEMTSALIDVVRQTNIKRIYLFDRFCLWMGLGLGDPHLRWACWLRLYRESIPR